MDQKPAWQPETWGSSYIWRTILCKEWGLPRWRVYVPKSYFDGVVSGMPYPGEICVPYED